MYDGIQSCPPLQDQPGLFVETPASHWRVHLHNPEDFAVVEGTSEEKMASTSDGDAMFRTQQHKSQLRPVRKVGGLMEHRYLGKAEATQILFLCLS